MATGSELGLVVTARQRLQAQGIGVRVVSLPCWELFDAQPRQYRDTMLPPSVRARLAVEVAVAFGWQRYVGDEGEMISVERFGASAAGEVVMREYGFTVDNVCERALSLLRRLKEKL